MSEARSRSNTPPCAVSGGQDMVVSLLLGEREVTSYRGRLAHQLPGKRAEARPLATPLINSHSRESSDLEMRTITSWGRVKWGWGGRYAGIYHSGSVIQREGQSGN